MTFKFIILAIFMVVASAKLGHGGAPLTYVPGPAVTGVAYAAPAIAKYATPISYAAPATYVGAPITYAAAPTAYTSSLYTAPTIAKYSAPIVASYAAPSTYAKIAAPLSYAAPAYIH